MSPLTIGMNYYLVSSKCYIDIKVVIDVQFKTIDCSRCGSQNSGNVPIMFFGWLPDASSLLCCNPEKDIY